MMMENEDTTTQPIHPSIVVVITQSPLFSSHIQASDVVSWWEKSSQFSAEKYLNFMNSLVDITNMVFMKTNKGSLRRRSYCNRVDLVNSTDETLFYKVLNVTDKRDKQALLANADVNVTTVCNFFSDGGGGGNTDDDETGKIHMNEFQSLLPIRSKCRKPIFRSVKQVCIAVFRKKKEKDTIMYLMHRIIFSGATWEIYQTCLDDLAEVRQSLHQTLRW